MNLFVVQIKYELHVSAIRLKQEFQRPSFFERETAIVGRYASKCGHQRPSATLDDTRLDTRCKPLPSQRSQRTLLLLLLLLLCLASYIYGRTNERRVGATVRDHKNSIALGIFLQNRRHPFKLFLEPPPFVYVIIQRIIF